MILNTFINNNSTLSIYLIGIVITFIACIITNHGVTKENNIPLEAVILLSAASWMGIGALVIVLMTAAIWNSIPKTFIKKLRAFVENTKTED